MAEAAIGFAASIAGLASLGIQIVTTLNTFVTSYARAEQQIKDLSANVAITSSILESIEKMIAEYKDKFQLTVDNYIVTRDQCDRNFQTLWLALKMVKRHEGMKKNKVKGAAWNDKPMGIWDKMMHAMGGVDALKELVLSIETSKSNLQLLLGSLNFLILKGLSKNNLLTEEQSDDFHLFMRQLPALVNGLRQAGLMKVNEAKRKSEDKTRPVVTSVATHADAVGATDKPPSPAPDNRAGGEKSVPRHGSKILEKGEVMEDPEDLSDVPNEATNPKENISKELESKSPNDKGVAEGYMKGKACQLATPPPPLPPGSRPTFSPDRRPYLSRRRESIPSASLDTQSIYEGWLLETMDPELDTVAVLCGLKMSTYRVTSSANYSIVPFSKDKEMLKKRANVSNTKQPVDSADTEYDKTLLEKMPKDSHREVRALLRDRNRRPTKPYGWKIAAVVEQTRKSAFSFGRRKSKTKPSWLIILRGGVVEPPVKKSPKRDPNLPRRYDNPWERPVIRDAEYLDPTDSSRYYVSYSSSSDDLRYRRRSNRRAGEQVIPRGMTASAERDRSHIIEESEEKIDEEEAEKLMNEYLTTFTKDDGKEKEKENWI